MKYLVLAFTLVFAFALALAASARASEATNMPPPTGPFAVGTTRLLFVDETRPEVFTDDPEDRREVTVRAWYPGDPSAEAVAAPYYGEAEEITSRFGYPSTLVGLETHSRFDIPVSVEEEKYPVILFNHGWGEHASQNTVLMEELASHGYVVFSLAHHHEAKFWVYPDGRPDFLSTLHPRFLTIVAEQSQPGIMTLFEAMFTTRGAAAQESLFRHTIEMMPTLLGESPRMWAEDIGFVIGEIDTLTRSDGLFEGTLDVENIGVMGMSMGGIAAGQACIGDTRIKASMNIDGGLFGDLPDTVLTQPTMFMGSRRFVGYDSVFATHVTGDVYTAIIGDADHYDFTDFTLLHRKHPMMGTVDGESMLEILNGYTLAFFDFYLKGKESDLLSGALRPYPEVDFRVRIRNRGSDPGR